MADNVVCIGNPWRAVAGASDEIADIVTGIPGWEGYEYSDETRNELESAAMLLRRAIPLLERASEREEAKEVDHGR